MKNQKHWSRKFHGDVFFGMNIAFQGRRLMRALPRCFAFALGT
jgi:hypothetical protein